LRYRPVHVRDEFGIESVIRFGHAIGAYSHVMCLTVTRFLDLLLTNAGQSAQGMTTGEPGDPVRRTWPEIHIVARRMAADLVRRGVVPGTSVALLAGEPTL